MAKERKNLTDGVSKKEKTELRYARLDPKERSIDPAKSLLLHAENEDTRDSGFYRDRIDGGLPEKLVMSKDYGNPTKAKDADVLLLTPARFDQFPDLLVAGRQLPKPEEDQQMVTQRARFNWGTSELVSYKNLGRRATQGHAHET